MGAGGSIDAGDTLWLTYSYNAFPATADPEENPADVTITFLAERA
jgi:hypothetical protein